MNIKMIALGKLIKPAKLRRADDKNYPVLSMTMHSGLVDQSDKFKKRIASSSTSSYKVVTRKQLVVGFPIDEGVLSFQELYDEAIVSPAYDIWDICKAIELETPYLEKFLRCPETLHIYRSKLRGTTARRRTIPNDIFLSILVPLPPIAEQKRIAEILDRTQSLISKRKEAIAKLDNLPKSIFVEMFGDNSPLEGKWNAVSFGDLIEVLTDYHANGSYEILRDNVVLKKQVDYALMVRTTDLENNNFDNECIYIDKKAYEFLTKSKVYGGEIIINKIGSAGKVYLMPYLDRPVSLGMNAFLIRLNNKVDTSFIYHFLTSSYGKEAIDKNVKGAVTKTITKEAIRGIKTPVPPLPLQKEFAQRVEAVEKLKATHSTSLSQLQALFASLQHRAFRGEL